LCRSIYVRAATPGDTERETNARKWRWDASRPSVATCDSG